MYLCTLLEFGIRFCNAFIFSLILLLLLCPTTPHIKTQKHKHRENEQNYNYTLSHVKFFLKKKKKKKKRQPFQTNYELLQLCFSLMNHEDKLVCQAHLPPTLQDPPALRNHHWLRTKINFSSLSDSRGTQVKFYI